MENPPKIPPASPITIVKYNNHPPKYPRGCSNSHIGMTDAKKQYPKIMMCHFLTGILASAERMGDGRFGPNQTINKTSGIKIAVASESFILNFCKQIPMANPSNI